MMRSIFTIFSAKTISYKWSIETDMTQQASFSGNCFWEFYTRYEKNQCKI